MAGVQIADAKAPFVMFERRAVEDRAKTIEEGRYVAKDVDFALITPHGSKDQIERVVSEWFAHLETQVREQRFDGGWLQAYRRAYDLWKEGKELPADGTPILNWPVLSPSQVRMLQDLHVLTVEVLAVANEELIRRMGMGGRQLVQKAQDYLLAAKDSGKAVESMAAMRAQIESMEKNIQTLTEANQMLRAQVPAAPQDAVVAAGLAVGPSGDGSINANDLGLTKL